jgi:hypothetical protein
VLQNRQYQYIPMCDRINADRSARTPMVVKIPPNIPHGAINFSAEPCLMVNAVIRHGASCAKDYQPLRQPFPYDLDAARAVWLAQQQQYPAHDADLNSAGLNSAGLRSTDSAAAISGLDYAI